jgi:hypothetical protein
MFIPGECVGEGDCGYSIYYLNAYSETEENQEKVNASRQKCSKTEIGNFSNTKLPLSFFGKLSVVCMYIYIYGTVV